MRYRRLLLFSLTLIFLALLTHDTVFFAGNDASRFAQIEALVDYGHTYIDESRYRRTVDRVTIDGKDYSNKPPLLSVIGAGVYYALKNGIGLTFTGNEAAAVYLLTLILVGVPAALLVAQFDAALGIDPSIFPSVRNLTTLALAAGTILTSFSVTLNNHPVAAALLFAASLAAWSGNGLMAGAWLALLICVDIVPGVVFAPFLGFIVYEAADLKSLYKYAVALSFGALMFVALNGWIVGSPLPPKMVPGAVDHSQVFAPGEARIHEQINVTPPRSWSHPLEALFGWQGFFSVSPVLLFGAYGMIRSMKSGDPLPRRCSILLATACTVLIAGHASLVGTFGGWSFGYRYLIPIIPILLFFAPKAIAVGQKKLFGVALAISTVFAYLGAYHPWPPVYEPEYGMKSVASLVTNPIGGNLSAWMQEHFPDLILTGKLGEIFIDPNEMIRAPYLRLFYQSKDYRETQ